MKPSMNISLIVVSTLTSEAQRIRFHLILSSYIGGTPKAEDLLSVKSGTHTTSPCHSCLVLREQIPYSSDAQCHNLRDTLRSLRLLDSGDETVREEFSIK